MSTKHEAAEGLSRREMISRLLGAGCTACLGALATSCPGGSDWGKPEKHAASGMADQLEFAVSDVPLNSARPVVVGGAMAFLVHYEMGGAEHWIALENKCTHKKSALNFDETEHIFKCPLHDSEFAMDGSVRERPGPKFWPAKRGLFSWPVEVDGDRVRIMADAGSEGAEFVSAESGDAAAGDSAGNDAAAGEHDGDE
ncbi:Rieske (2Fe-2S) protein [bacterium]|nr:Rieske (2Fe-2S) protein [bacterium]